MRSRSSALMWRVVFAGFLAIGAQSSFVPGVIQWKGLPAKRLVLSLSALPNQATVSSNGVPPQKLTILDQPLRHKSSSNDIPYFTPRPDKTIAWGASDLCIEASGDRSGDAVVASHCKGAPNQLWDFLPLSSGKQNQMQIRLKDTTACLDVNNKGKKGGWNEAVVQLRGCKEKMTESWEFEETMTFPMQDLSKLASSSNLQHASTTVISVAMLMIASLSVWMWRWWRSSMVPSRKNDTPSTADPGCVSLTVPVATRQGRAPLIFDQTRVPAVMALSTYQESIAKTPKEREQTTEADDGGESVLAVMAVAAKLAKKKHAVVAKPAEKKITVAVKPAPKKPGIVESQKLYMKRAVPPVLGALAIGNKKLVVITGASSGLGLWCTKALAARGDYYVIAAVRDTAKMEQQAKEIGIPKGGFCAMKLELASFQSVRDFVDNLKLFGRPPQSVICNAAVYRPTDPIPAWTDDGFEMSLGVNHLGHFLLAQLLLPELKKVDGAQLCIVGSVTGNSNTIAGSFVKPVAELGELQGLKAGGGKASRMPASQYEKFNGAKAYKDSKALNMMTVLELHRRYHEDTGIVFNSLYPGCIADTALFREKRGWFRGLFPKAMRAIGAYVGEPEAGERLAQVIHDPACNKSGVYWSWNGNGRRFASMASKERTPAGDWVYKFKEGAGGSGGKVFENEFAEMIRDEEKGRLAYEYSMDAVSQYL